MCAAEVTRVRKDESAQNTSAISKLDVQALQRLQLSSMCGSDFERVSENEKAEPRVAISDMDMHPMSMEEEILGVARILDSKWQRPAPRHRPGTMGEGST